MKGIIILDKDRQSELSENLLTGLYPILSDCGYEIETAELGKSDAAPCMGCFKCTDGKCIIDDRVAQIRERVYDYELTVYLTPILFGHFSAVVKNAIDRGTGSHLRQIVIGYGKDIDDSDKAIFIDMTAKHRGKADIVHRGMDERVDVFVSRKNEENSATLKTIKESMTERGAT